MSGLFSLSGPHVYMAGKITQNGWRHPLVAGLREHEYEDGLLLQDDFTYTGPFFVGCDHGCFHGPSQHGAMSLGHRKVSRQQLQVINQCMDGVLQCDVLFAYIDASDCYGTVAEIERALQLKKYVVITFSPVIDARDFWFVAARADDVHERVTLRDLPGLFERALTDYKQQGSSCR